MSAFKIPLLPLVLDVVGSILAVLGILGWAEVNIGLPVLASIWPILLISGMALMVPLIWWVIKFVRSKRTD